MQHAVPSNFYNASDAANISRQKAKALALSGGELRADWIFSWPFRRHLHWLNRGGPLWLSRPPVEFCAMSRGHQGLFAKGSNKRLLPARISQKGHIRE